MSTPPQCPQMPPEARTIFLLPTIPKGQSTLKLETDAPIYFRNARVEANGPFSVERVRAGSMDMTFTAFDFRLLSCSHLVRSNDAVVMQRALSSGSLEDFVLEMMEELQMPYRHRALLPIHKNGIVDYDLHDGPPVDWGVIGPDTPLEITMSAEDERMARFALSGFVPKDPWPSVRFRIHRPDQDGEWMGATVVDYHTRREYDGEAF